MYVPKTPVSWIVIGTCKYCKKGYLFLRICANLLSHLVTIQCLDADLIFLVTLKGPKVDSHCPMVPNV